MKMKSIFVLTLLIASNAYASIDFDTYRIETVGGIDLLDGNLYGVIFSGFSETYEWVNYSYSCDAESNLEMSFYSKAPTPNPWIYLEIRIDRYSYDDYSAFFGEEWTIYEMGIDTSELYIHESLLGGIYIYYGEDTIGVQLEYHSSQQSFPANTLLIDNLIIAPTPVPEPASLSLLALGILAFRRRKA